MTTKDSLFVTMFRIQKATSTLSNNKNEFIGKLQQDRVMVTEKGKFVKHATSTETYPTGLGRWIYSAYQCVRSS